MSHWTWHRLKPLLIRLLAFGLVVGGGWFGTRWFFHQARTYADELQEQQTLNEYRTTQLGLLDNLATQNNFIIEESPRLDLVINKDQIIDFIRMLEAQAKLAAVEVSIASQDNALLESKVTLPIKVESQKKNDATADPEEKPKPQSAKDKKKESGLAGDLVFPDYLRLTLTVIGPYTQIIEYLRRVETAPFALDILGLEMRAHEMETKERALVPGESPFAAPLATPETAPLEVPVVNPPFQLEAKFDIALYLLSR